MLHPQNLATAATPRKEIPLTLSYLEEEVTRLDSLVQRAVERYSPVRQTLPSEEADAKVRSTDYSTDVANALDSLTARLRTVAYRLEAFIDACEL